MPATITFFPVDNGDMTLVKLANDPATTLLIDVNIRQDADDPASDTRDVAKDLRDRLKKDEKGRPYVDAFLLSHPDQDHCRGIDRHFHLGPLSDYPDDAKAYKDMKIVIREIWSSPVVFRRASTQHALCDDAKAFNKEARRRVKANRDKKFSGVEAGDRILVLGEDVDGKTDDLGPILVKVDETFNTINGAKSEFFSSSLLAPLIAANDDEEVQLGKNHSSVIMNITIAADKSTPDGAKFLTGGDAEVYVWEKQWERRRKAPELLEYDLLQTPHHCSWHSLSWDGWSDCGEDAEVSEGARKALSQARDGATIVASCKPIDDDDVDPPCIRAKREYVAIAKEVEGEFYCTGEHPERKKPEPLTFTIGSSGLQPPAKKEATAKAAAGFAVARQPMPHG